MTARTLESLNLPRLRRAALITSAVGLLLCAIGFFVNRGQLFQSWLFAHQFFLAFALGGLAMLMVHHLMGGQWGILVARIFEAMAMTLPLLALLFLPVLLGMHDLYPWTRAEEAAHSPLLQAKRAYLNVPFFLARTAGYFAIWIVLAWALRRWSLARDRGPDPALTGRMTRTSALGLILYFLAMTFAAIDWMMSLEPEWFSTMFGAMVIVGQGLQALAFGSVMLFLIGDTAALRPLVGPKGLLDLGNMLMAFTVLWAYMAFAQYLIIWMGNISEETPWVIHRTTGGWEAVAIALIALNFFLPFMILLFRAVKRHPGWTAAVAVLILVMRLAGMHWLIAPTFHKNLSIHWLDLAALAAVGGVWTVVLFGALVRARPAPLHDPRMHALAETEGAHA